MLLDSNIIIYAAQPEQNALRRFIAENVPAVSIISQIEVLGYHQLGSDERGLFEVFFASAEVLPLSEAVADWAIVLRQRRRMTLGDAILAGTALAFDRVLVTHNLRDFQWIAELKLLDPLL